MYSSLCPMNKEHSDCKEGMHALDQHFIFQSRPSVRSIFCPSNSEYVVCGHGSMRRLFCNMKMNAFHCPFITRTMSPLSAYSHWTTIYSTNGFCFLSAIFSQVFYPHKWNVLYVESSRAIWRMSLKNLKGIFIFMCVRPVHHLCPHHYSSGWQMNRKW